MGFAGLVILGIAALAAFAWLSHRASEGSAAAKQVAIVESAVLFVLGAFGLLSALLLLSMRCDESCVGGEWRHTRDAWEWWAQFLVALGGTLGIALALLSTVRRRHDRAPLWLLVGAIGFGGWAAFLAPFGEGLGI